MLLTVAGAWLIAEVVQAVNASVPGRTAGGYHSLNFRSSAVSSHDGGSRFLAPQTSISICCPVLVKSDGNRRNVSGLHLAQKLNIIYTTKEWDGRRDKELIGYLPLKSFEAHKMDVENLLGTG